MSREHFKSWGERVTRLGAPQSPPAGRAPESRDQLQAVTRTMPAMGVRSGRPRSPLVWLVTPIVLLFILSCAGRATESTEDRIQRLGDELRCPVCRGVPISESPAALAKEMMDLLKDQVAQGKSDEEILNFFEERYGEWVLLDPKPEGMNLAVWILPILVVLGGSIFILISVKKKRG